MDRIVSVAPATKEDAPAIMSMIQELARSSNGTTLLDESFVNQYLAAINNHVLLAKVGGDVIGLLSYTLRLNLLHAGIIAIIEELVVRKENRQSGVGTVLMNDLFRRLERGGCKEIAVFATQDNKAALRFYRQHGLMDCAIIMKRQL